MKGVIYMDSDKIKNLISKYTPETINPNKIVVMTESIYESVRTYLDDNSKTKEELYKLLGKD